LPQLLLSVCVLVQWPLQQTPPGQAVPFVELVTTHCPVLGLQIDDAWQTCVTQLTLTVPAQTPFVQTSFVVQALLSSQVVPFGFAGLLHCPVEASQVPAAWH